MLRCPKVMRHDESSGMRLSLYDGISEFEVHQPSLSMAKEVLEPLVRSLKTTTSCGRKSHVLVKGGCLPPGCGRLVQ
jgi:hypothetical protein